MIDCTKSIDEAQNVLTNGGYNERYINIHIVKNMKNYFMSIKYLNDYLDTKTKYL